MAFGWSFPEVMVVVTLAFFLFGIPIMAYLMAYRGRRRKESRDE
jgi:hypothetical protein